MRPLLPALLLLSACGAPPSPPAGDVLQPGEPLLSTEGELLAEQWYSVRLNGSKLGHEHHVRRRVGSLLRTESLSQVWAHAEAPKPAFFDHYLWEETPDGRPLRFRVRSRSPLGNTDFVAQVRDGWIVLSGGATHPLEPDLLFPAALEARIRGLRPGGELAYRTLDASSGAPVRVSCRAEAEEGGLLRLAVSSEQFPGKRFLEWRDSEGRLARGEADLGIRISSERSSREEALWLETRYLVPRGRLGDPRRVRTARYRITVKEGTADPADFAFDGQTVERAEGRQLTLRVDPVRPGAPAEERGVPQAEDPAVAAAAREAVGDEKNAWHAARAIERWVHQKLRKEFAVLLTAKEVLERGGGDCSEHAQLAAAMARAAGVRARVCGGLAAAGSIFGEHAWTEVWVGRWAPIDAMMGGPLFDATHIRTSSSVNIRELEIEVLEAGQEPAGPPVEGYTDRLSYRAGDEVRFHVSSRAPVFSLEIARIGKERTVVWRKDDLPGKEHPVPEDASSRGCRWPVSLALAVPAEWTSGYYSGRLRATVDGKTAGSELFFVVRAAEPGKGSKILLQLATHTYNAYCNWGGTSLYAYNGRDKVQGRRVSYDRPIAGQFGQWEKPFVEWAEKAGYALEYAVNADLEFHPEILKAYRLVLSVGHDEYWSSPMRDHLEAFIAGGGNAAFFSGNSVCWQVRSEEGGRALACWKQAFEQDPFFKDPSKHALLSTLWSHHLVARPENALTGVGFLWGGYRKSHGQFMDAKAEFTVQRPGHWIFEGTGVKRGDVFGDKDTIVGYECDGCEVELRDGLPVPTGRDGTPKTFEILATCPARWHPDDCEWYGKWEKGRTGNAVMGVYSRGGTVVTVGTTDWSHGLRGNDPVVVRVTKNVLDRLSK